jgi:8-oxo-dGTP pyrophosphatase MutT (NUDIX family)
MREIQRTIVSALLFSNDGKLLMGLKDPSKGGVYPDAWHIPGGGVEEGETLEQALEREVQEEVGLSIEGCTVVPLSVKKNGVSEKTLKDTGEQVLCHMEFNYFEVYLPQNADEIELNLTDDLVETNWFSKAELLTVEQIPGGREFFAEMGYLDLPKLTFKAESFKKFEVGPRTIIIS